MRTKAWLALSIAVVLLSALAGREAAPQGRMTAVGTPRNETLIVYPFGGRTTQPSQQNPLMAYNVWLGMKDLGMGWLWETDTATGKSFPELASEMPRALNPEHTKFRIKLRDGVYWSDGTKFTADDVVFTLDTLLKDRETNKLTWGLGAGVKRLVKSVAKVDDLTLEVETTRPMYVLESQLGVYTWASGLSIVPKHIFEKQPDLSAFRNSNPVVLGPYTLEKFDENGFWSLWKRRDDWKRSAIGHTGKEPGPKYVLYRVFGTEENLALALIQNDLDGYGFISTEALKSVREKNPKIKGFSDTFPYHDFHEPCQHGVLMNLLKTPYNSRDVRWGLALSIDARDVGMATVGGETKVNPFPLSMTDALKPLYQPLVPWVESYTFADGYQPFDKSWTQKTLEILKTQGQVKDLPTTLEAAKEHLGIGWWKYDPQKAAELFQKAGLKKDGSGKWLLPNGTPWVINFAIPGDYNKLYQRQGLAIAAAWQKSGLAVNVRQYPQGEFGEISWFNDRFETQSASMQCPFNLKLHRDYVEFQKQFILPLESKERRAGNRARWANDTVDRLAAQIDQMDPNTPAYLQAGQTILREMIIDMPFIKVQEVPTTMAQNETYWTGWPKQNRFNTVPFLWWSSFKYQILDLKPTGATN
jgi:peptide/nickel transport system substrate-binding protein